MKEHKATPEEIPVPSQYAKSPKEREFWSEGFQDGYQGHKKKDMFSKWQTIGKSALMAYERGYKAGKKSHRDQK